MDDIVVGFNGHPLGDSADLVRALLAWHAVAGTRTEDNTDYRRVLYTGKNIQLVLMSLKPGDEIGEEVHEDRDQFFRIEQGEGAVVIDGVRTKVKADDAIIVPAGASHNVINSGSKDLQLYSLYAPPEHKEGTIHATKADEKEEHFDGKTTE